MSKNQTVWLAAYSAALSGLLSGVERPDFDRIHSMASMAANRAVKAFQEVNP